jgi:hypothetical protein
MKVFSLKLGLDKNEFSVVKLNNLYVGLINGVEVTRGSDYMKVSEIITKMAEQEINDLH